MASLFKSTINTRFIEESHKYIRSDKFINLSEDEIKYLIDNNYKLIVDLRRPIEIDAKPCCIASNPNFIYVNYPLNEAMIVLKNYADVLKDYRLMNSKRLHQLADKLINYNGRVVYFCSMGKDRTGVLSALILYKLGYNKEYIINNYMESYDNCKNLLDKLVSKNTNIDLSYYYPKTEYIIEFLNDLEINKEGR